MNNNRSKHHLLFPRAEWELRPEARKIRQTPSMVPVLTRENHDIIHDRVSIVPLLGHHTLNAIPGLWTPRGDTIRDIDSLCRAIDWASTPRLVQPIERDLAGLAIEALMMEKDILKEVGFEL